MMWSDRQGPAASADAAGLLIAADAGDGASIADIAGTVPTPDNPAAPSMQPGEMPCALHILVRYTLPEYISFMWQHGGYLIRRRHVHGVAALYMRLKSTASAALHFILLRRSRRTYEFTIDEHGIVRTSDTGVSLIGWEDVSAIRSYSPGFMMVLKRGTLPIPFRCLRGPDVEAMKCLAAARKANAAAHAAAAA